MSVDRTSVGLIQPQQVTVATAEAPMPLESGRTLGPVDIAYETYGNPNADRSNAILVCHALSGDAHAAGFHDPHDKRTGWWDTMIGPGKAFDTDRFWVICTNIIGGCKGSTGPASVNPATDAPYGLDFPVITIGDMVEAQRRVIDHLGIDRLVAVTGGSMGGFQAMEWALRFPDRVVSAIVLASSSRLSAQAISFNAVGRTAITRDPAWQNGHYYGTTGPLHGLAVARMVGHITYLSELLMDTKFGRRLQGADRFSYDFSNEFAVESYLNYQGSQFTERFDANSYLYITKAMDYFDISKAYGPLAETFARVSAKFCVVAYSTDWLFTTDQSKEVVRALLANDKHVSFIEVDSPYGHDAFLVEADRLTGIIESFLSGLNAPTSSNGEANHAS